MALRSENFLLRRYIEKAMVDLPAIPGIVIQVIQAADRDEVTTAEIEALISKDAAIATKILKVVNSAYFGLPRQVSTVGQAVVILGLHQVRNLAMSLGVLSALSSTNPRIMEYQKGFWSQSFAAAACAQEVARLRGMPKKDQDAIFVGGLLHCGYHPHLWVPARKSTANRAANTARTPCVRLSRQPLVNSRVAALVRKKPGQEKGVAWVSAAAKNPVTRRKTSFPCWMGK